MALTPTSSGPIGGHLNQLIANLSIEYRPTNARFITDDVFPVLPVAFENDTYALWDRSQRFRVMRTDGQDSLRADGTRASQKKYGWTYATYTTQEYAEEFGITDREAANTDAGLQLMQAHMAGIQDDILLHRELRVANLLTTAANYASTNKITKSGTSQWNNASFASQTTVLASQIKNDIDVAKNAIRQQLGGVLPNTIILPEPVAQQTENDFGLMDLLKHNGGITDLVNNGYPMAHGNKFFGLNILRPTGTYESENEGETSVVTDIWGKNAIICYVGPAAPRTLTFGLQFRKQTFGAMKTYRDEAVDTTFYRVGMNQTEKLVVANAGYLISAVIA